MEFFQSLIRGHDSIKKYKRTCHVFFAILFTFSIGISAQNPELSKAQRDSIIQPIGDLIYSSKFTEAHNEIIKNLYQYSYDVPLSYMLYIMLSDIERLTGNKDNAFNYIKRSKEVLMSGDKDFANIKLHNIYQRMANLFFEKGENDSAYIYALSALTMCEKYDSSNYMRSQRSNLPIIGHHYFLEGNYLGAENAYKKTIEINQIRNSNCENPLIYIKLADIHVAKKQYNEAVSMGNRAFEIADSCKNPSYKLAAIDKLSDIYLQFKKYEDASGSLQKKIKLMEEVNLYEQKNKLQELEAKFETTLKEEENQTLKIINQKQENQNRFQAYILILSGIILIIVLIFAILFFYQKSRITKQKKAVDRLNLLNQKIFSVISHDFKGPMMGLDLLLDMNEKYGLNKETFDQQTKQLRNDIKQAGLIMENLLNWSKTELGFNDLEKKNSDVKTVSEEVIAQIQSLADQKKIIMNNKIPAKNQLEIPPDILKIVLRNLLGNSIKYSYEGGVIELMYDPVENYYTIKDSGIGIDPERQSILFTKKLDSKLGTYHETGFGIGLNIVYELIRKYNGQIWVTSKPTEGTSIHFKFG